MGIKFLVFPQLEATGYRADGGAYITGVPQPTTICGLSHAIVRKLVSLGALESSHLVSRVMYGVTDFAELGESRDPKSRSDSVLTGKEKESSFSLVEMSGRSRGYVQFSLVLAILVGDDVPSDFEVKASAAVAQMRLNGGVLLPLEEPKLTSTLDDAMALLSPRTFVLTDEAAVFAQALEDDPQSSVPEVLGRLLQREGAGAAHVPWYVPALVGYARLSEKKTLPSVPGGYPYAYAEPLVGLARFRALASVRKSLRRRRAEDAATDVPGLFWGHSYDVESPDYYLVTAASTVAQQLAAVSR